MNIEFSLEGRLYKDDKNNEEEGLWENDAFIFNDGIKAAAECYVGSGDINPIMFTIRVPSDDPPSLSFQIHNDAANPYEFVSMYTTKNQLKLMRAFLDLAIEKLEMEGDGTDSTP